MQQDAEAAIESTTVHFPNIFAGWEVGGDRQAQAAVSLGNSQGSSWMSMEKRRISCTHLISKPEPSSSLEIWRVRMMYISFFFFSRKGGGEEFIDQQPEYQLLHEDTVRYI
jgi:hypothetical protein